MLGAKYQYLCKTASKWYKAVKKLFPVYYQELVSLAQGSNSKINEILLANCSDLFDMEIEDHCTSAVIKVGKHYYFIHNEDENSPDYRQDAYRYRLKIREDCSLYSGFGVCRSLIGASISLSNHVLQFVNTLTPNKVSVGIPRNIISRLILDCKNIQEVKNKILLLKKGSSYHHTLFFRKNSSKYSLEYADQDFRLKKITGSFFHTNHFLSKLKEKNRYASVSSTTRYRVMKENIKSVHHLQGIKKLMSNPQGYPYGVSREQTIYSVIIRDDFNRNLFYRGRPVTIENYANWTIK